MTYIFTNGELYHFGIPGMSWYNRRYQNIDGTWTDLGKERRRMEGGMSREERQAQKTEAKKAKLRKSIETNKGKAELERLKLEAKYAKRDLKETKHFEKIKDKLIRKGTAEDILKYSSGFDANELNTVLNRLRAEDAISKFTKKDKIGERITKLSNAIGAAGNALTNGTNAYNSFAKIYNSLMPDKESKLPVLDGKAKSERQKKVGRSDAELDKYLKELSTKKIDEIDPFEVGDRLRLYGLLGKAESAARSDGSVASLYDLKVSKPSGKSGDSKSDDRLDALEDALEELKEELRNRG